MKYLVSILLLSVCAACATRKEPAQSSTPVVSGKSVPRKSLPDVRTEEVVKTYSVGRYSDPGTPDTMHERHTVYRREQSPDWNYLPDPPVSVSAVGPSNQPGDARQRMYAEALQEQNRAMKQRIESLQQKAGQVPALEQEINQLKKEIRQIPPKPEPAASPASKTEGDLFSSVDPELPVADEFTDPGEITLFPESEAQNRDFLFSQMRLNDQFAAELEKAERRKRAAIFNAPFLRQREIAFLKPKTP